jgi:RNA polymerase sigma-70 factor (ECF subfamily)
VAGPHGLRGDVPGFDQLVEEHRARVAHLVYRLLGWSGEVEDVVQEVFLAALRGLPKFRGEASISTWLTRIAVNKCRTYRRRLWLRWWSASGEHVHGIQAPDSRVDQGMIDEETAMRVREAIQGLPGQYREVVVLRYLEEMDMEEIAQVLGVSRNALGVRLHRARRHLKDQLGDLIEE